MKAWRKMTKDPGILRSSDVAAGGGSCDQFGNKNVMALKGQ